MDWLLHEGCVHCAHVTGLPGRQDRRTSTRTVQSKVRSVAYRRRLLQKPPSPASNQLWRWAGWQALAGKQAKHERKQNPNNKPQPQQTTNHTYYLVLRYFFACLPKLLVCEFLACLRGLVGVISVRYCPCFDCTSAYVVRRYVPTISCPCKLLASQPAGVTCAQCTPPWCREQSNC